MSTISVPPGRCPALVSLRPSLYDKHAVRDRSAGAAVCGGAAAGLRRCRNDAPTSTRSDRRGHGAVLYAGTGPAAAGMRPAIGSAASAAAPTAANRRTAALAGTIMGMRSQSEPADSRIDVIAASSCGMTVAIYISGDFCRFTKVTVVSKELERSVHTERWRPARRPITTGPARGR
jgi:hypothetical protein